MAVHLNLKKIIDCKPTLEHLHAVQSKKLHTIVKSLWNQQSKR